MARIKIIRGTNLPNTATKTDCHDLVDGATAQVHDIVNSEIKSDAAIVDTKLNTISTIGKVNLTALVCASAAAGDILYMNNSGQVVRLSIGTAGQKLRVANIQMDYFEYATNALAQSAYVSNSNSYGTGGTITTVGNEVVHKFTSSGTFTPLYSGLVKVLVVAGGAGGASGGGGGGGVVYDSSYSVTAAEDVTVTIGAGSAGVVVSSGGAVGSNGENSIFGTITALGGGYAGNSDYTRHGGNGGCGGGGGASSIGIGYGGSGSQGYSGGDSISTSPFPSGGGGGAGGVGQDSVSSTASGAGGSGYETTILDDSTDYFGGGGGGSVAYTGYTPGSGGSGGGGAGNTNGNGVNGTANTGGGGGGATTGSTGGTGGSGIVIVRYPAVLNSYSESTIISQGTYALKVVALITDSLNDTLTRTVSPTIDLSGIDTLKFDIRSSRTGAHIKIGIHDSGGTTTEITPNITSANAWQTVTWDISGVSDANKNDIDSIIITIVNADATNTFYLDNFFIYGATDILQWVTP